MSSYAGCQNDTETPIDVNNNGVFHLNSRVRVVDVYDGLSQTLFVGEVTKSFPLGWVSGTRATLRNTGQPLNGLDRKLAGKVSPGPPPLPADLTALEFERMITSGERGRRQPMSAVLAAGILAGPTLHLATARSVLSGRRSTPPFTKGWATAPMASPLTKKPTERA